MVLGKLGYVTYLLALKADRTTFTLMQNQSMESYMWFFKSLKNLLISTWKGFSTNGILT
jgi:hypothetical protein